MNNNSTDSAKALRKVRIYRPHSHGGKRYTPGPEGVEIEVNEADAKFLQTIGATTRPAASAEVPTAAIAGGIRPQG